MTVKQILKSNHDIEIDILLAHVLKQPKEFLYLHPEHELPAGLQKKIEKLISQRRQGWPVAYLLGYKDFFGYKFKVNRDTLIPRPESEWLVEESMEVLVQKTKLNKRKTFNVIDVGTGSGCLAIVISNELSKGNVKIFASDISNKALEVAKINAKSYNAPILFRKTDLLKGIKEKFDLIVANLPYVPVSFYQFHKASLKYEPKTALTDSSDNFITIQRFLEQSKASLKPQGVILVETDPDSISILKKLSAKLYLNKKITIVKDIQNLKRFIKIA